MKHASVRLFAFVIVLVSTRADALLAVDANGNVVGTMLTDGLVLRQEGGSTVILEVTRDELHGGNTRLYYESTDCTGQAFVSVNGLIPQAVTEHDPGTGRAVIAYYPSSPIGSHTMQSYRRVSPPQEPCSANEETLDAGPAGSFDVSGFTPPFSTQ